MIEHSNGWSSVLFWLLGLLPLCPPHIHRTWFTWWMLPGLNGNPSLNTVVQMEVFKFYPWLPCTYKCTTFLDILLSGCWCLHLEKFCCTCINHVHVYSLPIPLSLFSSFSVFPSVLGGRVLYVCERVEEGGGMAQSCGLSAGAVLPIFWAL